MQLQICEQQSNEHTLRQIFFLADIKMPTCLRKLVQIVKVIHKLVFSAARKMSNISLNVKV